MFNHLVKIEYLTKNQIEDLADLALNYKKSANYPDISSKAVSLMFFENSTRTKISFELAAKNLSMKVINFDTKTSSINKGESLKETLENLYFIGVSACIIRTSDNNLIENLIKVISYPIHLINAGSGKTSHPTQALLDYVTMKEKFGSVENKKITIVGDIEHSRVAKSNIALLNKFGAKITVCSPEYFKPLNLAQDINYSDNLKEAITGADVVMGLRIQKERIKEAFSEEEYIEKYRLNSDLLNKYAPNALLMHPGPVNRNIEITSELLDSKKGITVLEQARNGMFTRMALLKTIMEAE